MKPKWLLHSRLSLAMRLSLIISLLTVFFTLILSMLVSNILLQRIKNDKGHQFHSTAEHMADLLDRSMFERYREIQIIAGLPFMRDPSVSLAAKRTLLEEMQQTYPDWAWIGITNETGEVLASTDQLLEGADVSQRPWFLADRQGPFVGDVHEALLLASLLPQPGDEPLRFVDVAAPLLDTQGRVIGVLGGHLSWTWADSIEAEVLVPLSNQAPLEIFILSADGQVLLGPDQTQPQIEALQATLNTFSGSERFQVLTTVNQEYLWATAYTKGYNTYPGLGWRVLVRQPTDLAFASAATIQRTVLLISLTAGIFAVMTVVGATRRIVHPLLQIARAAGRIQQGNPDVQIPVIAGHDEIALLSRSLNEFVTTLGEQKRVLQLDTERFKALHRIDQLILAGDSATASAQFGLNYLVKLLDAAEGQISLLDGTHEHPLATCTRPERSTAITATAPLVIPLIAAGQPIGMLKLTLSEDQVLADDLMQIAHEVATQLAIGIQQVKYREQIIRHNAELEQRVVERTLELQKALTKEKEFNDLKLRFTAMISHEFRTPLTIILSASEMLLNYSTRISEEKKNHHLNQVRNQVIHMVALLDDILNLNKVEALARSKEFQTFDLQDFCHDLITEIQQTAPQHTLHLTVDGDCTAVTLNKTLMRHALANLLSNAIKYSPGGKAVHLALACSDTALTIQVKDEGMGIPLEEQANLFQTYFRAKNVGSVSGTGLGLAIVKEAVEAHGGHIQLESLPGTPTTFTLTLPKRMVGSTAGTLEV